MPSYQGIKLDVISQLELRIHPEFPHPESSQFTYRSTSTTDETSSNLVSSSVASDSKADKLLGRSSTISVYIPSFPGARFWLRYNVSGVVEPKAPWYYFKLYMNGRLITSWGTHSIFRPQGQVMRALYDPTPRWNYKIEETVYKNCGNEIRPFYFSNVKGRSAADDGGLIEVRVFRSKGRRRTMPTPAEFRPQDHYGLVLPSTGLTEDFEESKFYEWILIDRVDRAFATFKFHYRSWDNLSSLNLIPSNHPRCLLFPSPSLLSLNGQSANALRKKDALKRGENDRYRDSVETFSSEGPSSPPKTPPRSYTYNDETGYSEETDRRHALSVPRSPSPYYHNLSPRSLEALGFFAPPIPRLPSAAQLERAQILNRPLPEIPREPRISQLPRRVSESSDAPSITSSLRSHYGDGGRSDLSPSPVLKTAIATRFYRSKQPPKIVHVKKKVSFEPSHSDSTPPAPTSRQQLGGIFSGISRRKHRRSSLSTSRSDSKTSFSDHDKKSKHREEYQRHDDDMTAISVTESEWLSNVPSTSLGKVRDKHVWRARSLGRDDYADDAETSLLAQEGMDSHDSAAGTERGFDTNSLRSYDEVEIPGGWI